MEKILSVRLALAADLTRPAKGETFKLVMASKYRHNHRPYKYGPAAGPHKLGIHRRQSLACSYLTEQG